MTNNKEGTLQELVRESDPQYRGSCNCRACRWRRVALQCANRIDELEQENADLHEIAAGQVDLEPLGCFDCGLAYGSEGWADAVLPDDEWKKIAPSEDGGGVLCFTCMNRRALRAGVECDAKITSGPFSGSKGHSIRRSETNR